jgi:ATP-dependent DNA helicase DinG
VSDRIPGQAGNVVAVPIDEVMAQLVGALPAGETRAGQLEMATAVAQAVTAETHLVVQAGTGTGKTLAYLAPILLSGARSVVVTATKALQEQLVGHDLPFLHDHLGVPFTAALLKGRSNYLCRAALADAVGGTSQGSLDGVAVERQLDRARVAEVVAWSAETQTGDRADLPVAVSDAEWSRLSVGVGECPGASRCSYGDVCFAEDARAAAAAADVVVVNMHLYGLHLASGATVLPDHEVCVVDEAHGFEDVAADTLGCEMGPGRLDNFARVLRGLFTADHPAVTEVLAAGSRLGSVLDRLDGRVDPAEGDLAIALLGCGEAVASASSAARGLEATGDAATRKERVLQLAGHIGGDLVVIAQLNEDQVAWVEPGSFPRLRVAPVDVGATLAERLLQGPTVVFTSATLAVGGSFQPFAHRVGLDRGGRPWESLDVGSPFDYDEQALLYCAAHLPDPRAKDYEPAMLDELERLIRAAGGRTLALFTSRRAMRVAADRLSGLLPWDVLVQDDLPRPILHRRFLDDETSVVLATMGFWQGFDAPGRTCSLVVIDRLPFARPDDPLAEARRAAATRARQNAFQAVDLPAAAVLLAQGSGRLVRTARDRGVVAVLDRRLASAAYRWTLVRSLPPMRRTKDFAEVERFLASITSD